MEGWPFGLAGAGLAWLNMHAAIAFWVKSSIAKPICVLCAGTYLFEGFAALGPGGGRVHLCSVRVYPSRLCFRQNPGCWDLFGFCAKWQILSDLGKGAGSGRGSLEAGCGWKWERTPEKH